MTPACLAHVRCGTLAPIQRPFRLASKDLARRIVRLMKRGFLLSLLALVFVSIPTVAVGAVPWQVGAQDAHSISKVALGDFVLKPSGILFSFHPTDARIVLSAVADERLRVCEDGTTFSHYWTGGCRVLTRLPLSLPTSGGAVHVGFRVLPSTSGASARITNLRVLWHCVDHDFILMRGTTRVRRPIPTFDC